MLSGPIRNAPGSDSLLERNADLLSRPPVRSHPPKVEVQTRLRRAAALPLRPTTRAPQKRHRNQNRRPDIRVIPEVGRGALPGIEASLKWPSTASWTRQ
jgi:hypothetical protein